MVEQIGKHFVLLNAGGRVGGLSTVRKGIDTRDGTEVAVKFIAAATDELTRKVFERERQTLRSLTHPNIVRFRDAGVDETGTYFIVLDWVDRNLADLLDDPPWRDWQELYRPTVLPLLEALSYAHLKQVEHRDVKPKNILIDRSGLPLLADFGISKVRAQEEHSELTVHAFRSGVYAPPEFDAVRAYVRDVYSLGVVILQCLSNFKIRELSDVSRALTDANVPPDIRTLLEACVSHDPMERPANGSELLSEFKKLESQRVAREARPRNPLWLDLTNAAVKHLVGEPIDRQRATAKLRADLGGDVFICYGLDPENGERSRDRVRLVGAEHVYEIRVDPVEPKLVAIAAPAKEFEQLEGIRKHSLALPPIFSWIAIQPMNPAPSKSARDTLFQLLDEFYDRKDNPETGVTDQDGDELFETWIRLLEAREDLARGVHQPIAYKSAETEGRRTYFTLAEDSEADLIGSAWQVLDPLSTRRFGHGEVIDQDADRLTLLSSRQLTGLPRTATLIPYDAPSSIALNRQRNAVLGVRDRTTPAPDLRDILIDPSRNGVPEAVEVTTWSMNLDATKKRAVELALGASELLAVHGPPGTGKTSFIAETVLQTLRQTPTARILIASQTHVAVDNAVERLHEAGVEGIVRLAGADESSVHPSVRDLLLDRQLQKWSQSVRIRAENNISAQASKIGIQPQHLRAALTLEQIVTVSRDLEHVQSHVDNLAAGVIETSELMTAISDEDQAERYQDRLDQLSDRRADLQRLAQSQLGVDLTLPPNLDSAEALAAVDSLLGESQEARDLLRLLELQADWLERIGAEDSLAAIYLAGTSVVAGTCTGFLRNRAVGQVEFDLCIVDEASKATLTEALVPMSRAKQWILVGDTRQLPPMDEDLLRASELLQEHNLTADDVTETLFQRLVTHLPPHSQVALDEQYRMIRPIGDLISSCFYEGALRSPRTQGLNGYSTVAGHTVTWLDTSSLGEQRYEKGAMSFANRAEAQVILRQMDRVERAIERNLIRPERPEPLDVLVIAPYKSQVEELRRRVASRTFKHLSPLVLSVDAVQGRQADLAFVSLTRSNTQGRLGFLGSDYWRRINVALSRARYGLTIVGDAGFIRGTNGALRTVLEYIEQHTADCGVRQADLD
ncbi:MAG: AAA domain-containing protein [Jatrophihabitantaceae bacterium]